MSGYRARLRLYRAGAGEGKSEPRRESSIERVVRLPPTRSEGVTDVTVFLATDDVGRPQGSLDALAEESRAIADELRSGRLDATTLERQDRFLQRLLEAGRTLEQDGPTDERQATSARDVGRRAVTALPQDLLDPLGFPLPTPEELEALTPGQRRLVLDYFDRVNRRRASEGPR